MPAKRERTWTLISVMALSGVVKVDCVIGAERSRREERVLDGGGERKGVMQAFQPHFITMLNGN